MYGFLKVKENFLQWKTQFATIDDATRCLVLSSGPCIRGTTRLIYFAHCQIRLERTLTDFTLITHKGETIRLRTPSPEATGRWLAYIRMLQRGLDPQQLPTATRRVRFTLPSSASSKAMANSVPRRNTMALLDAEAQERLRLEAVEKQIRGLLHEEGSDLRSFSEAKAVEQLVRMGFTESHSIEAVRQCGGDVLAALDLVMQPRVTPVVPNGRNHAQQAARQRQPVAVQHQAPQSAESAMKRAQAALLAGKVANIVGMGFAPERARAALDASNGDVTAAVEYLLEQGGAEEGNHTQLLDSPRSRRNTPSPKKGTVLARGPCASDPPPPPSTPPAAPPPPPSNPTQRTRHADPALDDALVSTLDIPVAESCSASSESHRITSASTTPPTDPAPAASVAGCGSDDDGCDTPMLCSNTSPRRAKSASLLIATGACLVTAAAEKLQPGRDETHHTMRLQTPKGGEEPEEDQQADEAAGGDDTEEAVDEEAAALSPPEAAAVEEEPQDEVDPTEEPQADGEGGATAPQECGVSTGEGHRVSEAAAEDGDAAPQEDTPNPQ